MLHAHLDKNFDFVWVPADKEIVSNEYAVEIARNDLIYWDQASILFSTKEFYFKVDNVIEQPASSQSSKLLFIF